jgi:diaminohydroxyphosphoribosylaminopyrimidine deaminase/5-amino-6-(5-phosphoribosylamino)uracil reductase
MKRCLQLARLGETQTAPNPMVGCVIVHNHKIVAEGFHKQFGGPHAEVNAVNALPSSINPQECVVYVSLEPCSHYGKTPPCSDLLIKLQPRKVVVGMLDPNPKVAGKGLERIKQEGIEVVSGVLQEECEALNKKFIVQHTLKRPFITLKWAETANGYMGRPADSEASPQISHPRNALLTHQLRASHQAILIGRNTLDTDHPQLNTRYAAGKNPIKIVLTSQFLNTHNYPIFQTGKSLIYGCKGQDTEHFSFNESKALETILSDLYSRDIQSVLVEGGANVLQQFINEGLWDEIFILTSKENWNEGITAPRILKKKLVHTEEVNNDIITIYRRMQ